MQVLPKKEGVYDPFRIDIRFPLGRLGGSMVSTFMSPCGLKTGGGGFNASHTCQPNPTFVFGASSVSRKQTRESFSLFLASNFSFKPDCVTFLFFVRPRCSVHLCKRRCHGTGFH